MEQNAENAIVEMMIALQRIADSLETIASTVNAPTKDAKYPQPTIQVEGLITTQEG